MLTMALFTGSIVVLTATNECAARHHKKSDTNTSDSPVTMQVFPIERGYDGAQFIVTPKGYTVSLPGLGVAPDATQLAAYRDAENNYWYIDRTGNAVKLTTDQMQWIMAQINQQAQAQGMMQPNAESAATQQPAQNVVVVQQPASQSSSGGSPLVTGLAAAGGAMAGAALGTAMYHNNYNGIPYGVPVYHHGGRYYYNGANGNKVYVNKSTYVNQWNHQNNWQNMQHNHPTQLPANRPNSGNHHNTAAQFPSGGSNHQRPNYQGKPQQMPAGARHSHHGISGGGSSRQGHGGATRGARGGGGRRR
jgi:hypothetical protein